MTKVAIENGPVEIVDFPIKNSGSFHSFLLNYQRVVMEFLALWSAQTLLESKELCAALMRRLKAQLEVVFMVKKIASRIDGFFREIIHFF